MTNVLHLADRIAFQTEKYDIYYDNKKIVQKITKNSGSKFWPKDVLAYQELSRKEYFCLDIKSPEAINSELDKALSLLNEQISLNNVMDISKITSYIVDFRSPFTTTHSIGISAVSKELFKLMGSSKEEQLMMGIAGYLHDIGKLIVPSNILNKAGKLNTEEWRIMRSHTYYTYQVLKSLDELPCLKEWAAYHHETLDGRGYPFHLKANQLSQGARVMAVADIFTAITEDRPYRKGMKKSKVISILKDLVNNYKLDQDIVNLLIENYHNINSISGICQVSCRI